MFKYVITFYFYDCEPIFFEYNSLEDILYDLNYDLSNVDNSCTHWIIERIDLIGA